MLQARLQHLIGIRCGCGRFTIGICGAGTVQEVVVVHGLPEGEVALITSTRVADNIGVFLGNIGGNGPRLD